MLSWWSRYIGISPYFSKPIRLTIEKSRITKVEGGDEAEALRRFLTSMRERLGELIHRLGMRAFLKAMDLQPVPQIIRAPRANPYYFWDPEEVK